MSCAAAASPTPTPSRSRASRGGGGGPAASSGRSRSRGQAPWRWRPSLTSPARHQTTRPAPTHRTMKQTTGRERRLGGVPEKHNAARGAVQPRSSFRRVGAPRPACVSVRAPCHARPLVFLHLFSLFLHRDTLRNGSVREASEVGCLVRPGSRATSVRPWWTDAFRW